VNVVNTLPAPVIQMGYVEKIVEMQQNLPYVQQLAAGEAAVRALEQHREKIEAGTATEPSARVRERDSGQGGGENRPARDGETAGDSASEDGGAANTGRPWSGRLVDITI
jgi:hypothetical protein